MCLQVHQHLYSVTLSKTTVTHTHTHTPSTCHLKCVRAGCVEGGGITEAKMDLVTRTKKYIHLPLLFITQRAMETRWEASKTTGTQYIPNQHTCTAGTPRVVLARWGERTAKFHSYKKTARGGASRTLPTVHAVAGGRIHLLTNEEVLARNSGG